MEELELHAVLVVAIGNYVYSVILSNCQFLIAHHSPLPWSYHSLIALSSFLLQMHFFVRLSSQSVHFIELTFLQLVPHSRFSTKPFLPPTVVSFTLISFWRTMQIRTANPQLLADWMLHGFFACTYTSHKQIYGVLWQRSSTFYTTEVVPGVTNIKLTNP